MSGRNGAATETLQEALARLVAEEGQAMVDRAEKFLGSVHDAEEAVQEASRNAVRALPSLRDPRKLRTWYLRLLWTQCVDLQKRRVAETLRQAPLVEDPRPESDCGSSDYGEEDESAWAGVAEAPAPYYPDDTAAFLREQIASLPAELRLPIEQVYFEGRSLAEVGRESGLPETTLGARLRQGLALLEPRLARLRRDLER